MQPSFCLSSCYILVLGLMKFWAELKEWMEGKREKSKKPQVLFYFLSKNLDFNLFWPFRYALFWGKKKSNFILFYFVLFLNLKRP